MSTPPWMLHPLYLELDTTIRSYAENIGMDLTDGARQMLIIPILEHNYETGKFDADQVNSSLQAIFHALKEAPEGRGGSNRPSRNAKSVIWAFWKQFCNIPPFCGPTRRR